MCKMTEDTHVKVENVAGSIYLISAIFSERGKHGAVAYQSELRESLAFKRVVGL